MVRDTLHNAMSDVYMYTPGMCHACSECAMHVVSAPCM